MHETSKNKHSTWKNQHRPYLTNIFNQESYHASLDVLLILHIKHLFLDPKGFACAAKTTGT